MGKSINAGFAGPDAQTRPFEIAGREIHPRRNEIVADGQRRRIERRAMTLLRVLSRTPGETVSRSELLEEVWPGLIVGDDSLTQAVSKLRRALGDLHGAERIIETVPKIGYRLTQAPRPLNPAALMLPVAARRLIDTGAFRPNGQFVAGALVALTLVVGVAFVAQPWTQTRPATPTFIAPGAVLPSPGEGKMLIYRFELREPLAEGAATPVVAYN